MVNSIKLNLGGGFAGILAAYELQYAGYDVEVIEARKRVGGRVKSKKNLAMDIGVNDRYIEHGAELIGESHALWRVLAKKLELSFIPVSKDVQDVKDIDLDHFRMKGLKRNFKFRPNKVVLRGLSNMKQNLKAQIMKDTLKDEKDEGGIDFIDSEDKLLKFTPEMEKAIEDFYLQMSNDSKLVFIPDPIYHIKTSLNSKTIEFDMITVGQKIVEFVRGRKFKKEDEDILIEYLNSQLLNDNGISVDKQSYLFTILVVRGGGGDSFLTRNEIYRCKEGNQELANRIAKEIGKDHIHLSTNCQKVVSKDNKVYIYCEKKETPYIGDYVVMAVPSSILDNIQFEPNLQVLVKGKKVDFDPKKIIQNGKLFKYIMKTKNSFWYEKEDDLEIVSSSYGEVSLKILK